METIKKGILFEYFPLEEPISMFEFTLVELEEVLLLFSPKLKYDLIRILP